MLDFLMTAIWIAFAVLAVAATCIVRLVMYPTLRRHGIDPSSRGSWNESNWEWITQYKSTCVNTGLSLRYWRLYWLLVALAGFLCVGWLLLLLVQFARFVSSTT